MVSLRPVRRHPLRSPSLSSPHITNLIDKIHRIASLTDRLRCHIRRTHPPHPHRQRDRNHRPLRRPIPDGCHRRASTSWCRLCALPPDPARIDAAAGLMLAALIRRAAQVVVSHSQHYTLTNEARPSDHSCQRNRHPLHLARSRKKPPESHTNGIPAFVRQSSVQADPQ